MQLRSPGRVSLCAAVAGVMVFATTGAVASSASAAASVRAPSRPSPLAGVSIPLDVRAAVAAGPTDVLVAIDSTTGLRLMRQATRAGLGRRSRQAAADASASAYASTKRDILRGRLGVSTRKDFRHLPIQLVRVDSPAALDALAATPGVISVSLPRTRTVDAVPNNLALIQQPAAETAGHTGAGTRVAVLDTGADYTLAGATTTFGDCSGGPGTGTCRIKQYVDITASGQLDVDPGHHGTNVSGVVATVAPAAELSVYNVFTNTSGLSATDTDVLEALDQVAASAAATNTRAVNLSLGDDSYHTTACSNSSFASAFASLRGLGVVPVVAAGNSAYTPGPVFHNGVSDPACVPGAVSVGAVYSAASGSTFIFGSPENCRDVTAVSDKIACFAQTGPVLSMFAPGVSVTAAGVTQSGTSQAAPHVAAAAAILAGANPSANAEAIVTALTSTGPTISDTRTTPATTAHRLDVFAAVGAITAATAPGPPTSVTAVAGTASATVSWQSPASNGGSAITGYAATASPGGASCTTTGATSCTVAGLTAGTAYTFTVTASNAAGTSAPSAASAAVVTFSVPGVPTSVTAAGGAASATVSWVAPVDSGGTPITTYLVVASPGGATCLTTGTACTLTGLTNGTTYTFTVTATNSVGTGAGSAASAVPVSVSGAPRSTSGVRGNARATVSWLAPAETGGTPVTGYTAVAAPGGASCTTTALTCTVTGLANGTSYRFTVRATNAVGISAASPSSAVVVPATAPGRATGLRATRGHRTAVVTWTAPPNGGSTVTGYRVVATPGGRACTTTGATRCTVTGLANGRAYRFTVVASNAVGRGPASIASAAAIPAPVPGVPTRVAVVRGNARGTVSWAAPGANGTPAITGYRVVATGGRSCSAGIAARRCTIAGLVNGRRYVFTVVAINRVGAGPASPGVAVVPARV